MKRTVVTVLMLLAAVMARGGDLRLSVFGVHLDEMVRQRGITYEEAVRDVKSWGIEGVDLWYGTWAEKGNSSALAGGLKPAALIYIADFAHTNNIERDAAVLAYAKRTGAPRIMLVPGWYAKGEDPEAAWAAMKPNLGNFIRRAEQAGLEVDAEDFDGDRILFGSQKTLRRAFAEFPKMGHVLDTGNYDFWKEDVLAAQKEFGPRIRHVHIKDRAKDGSGRSVAAGTGRIPIPKVVANLRAANYKGYLTLECFGSTNTWNDIRRAAEFMRKQ